MWRLLIIRLHALQFERFHRPRLALDLFFQPLQQFALLDDDAIQLFNLVLEVSKVGFQLVRTTGIFGSHEMILPAPGAEVESRPFAACVRFNNAM